MKIQSSAADCAVQVHGGQLSLTFSYTIWVDQHASLNRIYLKSAVRKICLTEGGYVHHKMIEFFTDYHGHTRKIEPRGYFWIFYQK